MSYTDLPQEHYEMGADRMEQHQWTRISEAEPECAEIQGYAPGAGIIEGDYVGDGLIESHFTGNRYQITHWASIDAGPLPTPKSH